MTSRPSAAAPGRKLETQKRSRSGPATGGKYNKPYAHRKPKVEHVATKAKPRDVKGDPKAYYFSQQPSRQRRVDCRLRLHQKRCERKRKPPPELPAASCFVRRPCSGSHSNGSTRTTRKNTPRLRRTEWRYRSTLTRLDILPLPRVKVMCMTAGGLGPLTGRRCKHGWDRDYKLTMRALIASLFFFLCLATAAQGAGCQYGAIYLDGCMANSTVSPTIAGAPVGANYDYFTVRHSDFFSGYANQSRQTYATCPPWNVAGVDYPVGIDAVASGMLASAVGVTSSAPYTGAFTTGGCEPCSDGYYRTPTGLKDPLNSTNLSTDGLSGCHYVSAQDNLACSSTANIVVNGYDFANAGWATTGTANHHNMGNCVNLNISGSNTGTVTITNNLFINGSPDGTTWPCHVPTRAMVIINAGTNTIVANNWCDINQNNAPSSTSPRGYSGMQNCFTGGVNTPYYYLARYNVIMHSDNARGFSTGGNGTKYEEYNWAQDWGWVAAPFPACGRICGYHGELDQSNPGTSGNTTAVWYTRFNTVI